MARSPIYSTLTKVQGMITYVRMNLSEEEYDLFLDMLVPEPEPEVKTVKRGRKKGGKSKRAASLEEQIKPAIGKPHLGIGPVCTVCSHTEDFEDHAQPSPHYHPFAPPASSAKKKSSPKDVETNSTVNTATETEGVSTAAGAGG